MRQNFENLATNIQQNSKIISSEKKMKNAQTSLGIKKLLPHKIQKNVFK